MSAPNLTFEISGTILSDETGYNFIRVTFTADAQYQAFECRATRVGEEYGVGKGALVASFSFTPSGTERTFEIYDDYLVQGDGEYRISLFAQSESGAWNDNYAFIPSGSDGLTTADGEEFLCMRG